MVSPVEQIKERLDIAEVLSGYIKIDKAGQNYKARCPFHNEKTPSFFISPSRQSFYCFGCQASGDIFSFVERIEGLDFVGALKLLAEKAGVPLQNFEPKAQEHREKLHRILELSTQFFEKNLKEDSSVQEYTKTRGLTEESIKNWRIGFAREEWRELHDFLLKEGFTREDILATGMLKQAPGDKYYDTFRNRVMFPIFDTSGRVIAFSGRSLSLDPKVPKYLNSPETELFKKSEVLYGLHNAKSAIRSSDYSVLVEGQIDLVLSHQSGVAQTVASSGTALTEFHLKRLQKISNRVVCAYDGDEAGVRATLRAVKLAFSIGMEVKVASLPEGEDPADYIKKNGAEAWKDLLRNTKDGIQFALAIVQKANTQGPALIRKIGEVVLPLIASLSNEMIKSHYVSIISQATGIPSESVRAELSKQKSLLNSKEEKIYSLDKVALGPEQLLVGLILLKKDEETKNKFIELLGEEMFTAIEGGGESSPDILMFEAEKLFNGEQDEKIKNELLSRVEKQSLQNRMRSIAALLDLTQVEAEKGKLQEEMNIISKKLSQLSG